MGTSQSVMMGKNWGCDSVVGRRVGIGGVTSLAHMMGFDWGGGVGVGDHRYIRWRGHNNTRS